MIHRVADFSIQTKYMERFLGVYLRSPAAKGRGTDYDDDDSDDDDHHHHTHPFHH